MLEWLQKKMLGAMFGLSMRMDTAVTSEFAEAMIQKQEQMSVSKPTEQIADAELITIRGQAYNIKTIREIEKEWVERGLIR